MKVNKQQLESLKRNKERNTVSDDIKRGMNYAVNLSEKDIEETPIPVEKVEKTESTKAKNTTKKVLIALGIATIIVSAKLAKAYIDTKNGNLKISSIATLAGGIASIGAGFILPKKKSKKYHEVRKDLEKATNEKDIAAVVSKIQKSDMSHSEKKVSLERAKVSAQKQVVTKTNTKTGLPEDFKLLYEGSSKSNPTVKINIDKDGRAFFTDLNGKRLITEIIDLNSKTM